MIQKQFIPNRLHLTNLLLVFCLIVVAILPIQASTASPTESSTGDISPVRRANIPFTVSPIQWEQSAILWFGVNEQGVPSKNYVDVRLTYTELALEIRFTVIDYYLWYNINPQESDDLTQYDAVAVYVDTNLDRSSQPQSDDYMFLSGSRHWPNDNAPQYHRDARGNGTGWNTSWTGPWADSSAMQWDCNPGPNSNDCGIDYGWYSSLSIPWSTLGYSGPPSNGEIWGLGLVLYDRDDNPPAGDVAPQFWPETFQQNDPASWGEIHFGYPEYHPETTGATVVTTIRAASPTDNTVEDAWMGGGGSCAAGHNGGSEINHGDDPELFSGSEAAPTHFPCFNKSFLRFQLDAIPPGVNIISSTLMLHHWGNADDAIAPEFAWVHLFSISDHWEEMSIHWNNAPLAQENISYTKVKTLSQFPGWPGIAYYWDATRAVAEAYGRGEPVNLAIYSSDVGRDTSKYFVASETGDWNIEARPTLVITWEYPNSSIDKVGSQSTGIINEGIAYSITWQGTGDAQTMIDQLPPGFSNPINIQVNTGSALFNASNRQIQWSGSPAQGQTVTLTYQVTVQIAEPMVLTNISTLSDSSGILGSDHFDLFVNPYQVNIPLITR